MVRVLIKPVSKTRFRGSGTFEPTVRGPFTYAETLPYPLPSTITGVLASKQYIKQLEKQLEVYDLLKELFKKLQCKFVNQLTVRPGYITVKKLNSSREEYYVALGEYYIKYEFIEKILTKVLNPYFNVLTELIKGNSSKADQILENLSNEITKILSDEINVRKYSTLTRIGIGLERGVKVTKTGYIYSASDLDLYSIFINPCRNEYVEEVAIAAEVLGVECNEAMRECFTARFAGEGYPAEVIADPQNIIMDKLEDKEQCLALIQLTPIIIQKDLRYLAKEYTPWTFKKIIEQMLDKIAEVYLVTGELAPLFKAELDVLIPGYSLKDDKYRDPELAIKGNTLTIARGNPREIYYKGLGEKSELGWGTILPIPVKDSICDKAAELAKL